MIPKRSKETDIATEIAQGKHFKKRLLQSAEEAAGRFIRGESLNFAIADISRREKFNQLQIQRLVEESNTVAFNKRYDEKRKENDRRISFELAELEGVLKEMGAEAPPSIDNPNWVKGKPGEGELVKSASTSSVHRPLSNVEAAREKLQARQEMERRTQLEKQAKTLSKDIESGIFKIANSIVLSEKNYKNGNEIFNTMLSNVGFEDFIAEGITKKASEIAAHMKNSGRLNSQFMLSLEIKPEEKIASTLLGSRSLVKTASETDLVKEPKVFPVQEIGDYQKLIDLAKTIQHKQQETLKLEQQVHGGMPGVQ